VQACSIPFRKDDVSGLGYLFGDDEPGLAVLYPIGVGACGIKERGVYDGPSLHSFPTHVPCPHSYARGLLRAFLISSEAF
jgi:hypothetical protein